jgi:tetratricopeptide (TPR) repeat protein
LKPDHVEARFGLAACLAEAHEYDKAIEEYKRLEHYPDQKDRVNRAYSSLAVSLDKSREYDKAIELYKHLMDLDENDVAAVNNLARLYILRREDAGGALALLNKLRDRYSALSKEERYYYHKNRGWAHLKLQSYGSAKAELSAAINLRDGASAHFLLGMLLESQAAEERISELKAKLFKQAKKEWGLFTGRDRQDPDQEKDIEPGWPAYAQQRLLNRKPVEQPEKGDEK